MTQTKKIKMYKICRYKKLDNFLLNEDGRHTVEFLLLVEATSSEEAKRKAAGHLKNNEILTKGFYSAELITINERWTAMKRLQTELDKYVNILR